MLSSLSLPSDPSLSLWVVCASSHGGGFGIDKLCIYNSHFQEETFLKGGKKLHKSLGSILEVTQNYFPLDSRSKVRPGSGPDSQDKDKPM